jgi:transposase-like protein
MFEALDKYVCDRCAQEAIFKYGKTSSLKVKWTRVKYFNVDVGNEKERFLCEGCSEDFTDFWVKSREK